MLSRDSEDEIWSRFVFELVIWPQPSGPLCLWQCLYLNLEKEPVVGMACTKEPRMLQIPKATISWLASTGFPPAKTIVVKMVFMSMILILGIMIKAVMTMIPSHGLYLLVVALEHSRVLAIFCSMVFTSDHLCIQSVKCTHCTWVVWNENCATRNREYSRVLECHH